MKEVANEMVLVTNFWLIFAISAVSENLLSSVTELQLIYCGVAIHIYCSQSKVVSAHSCFIYLTQLPFLLYFLWEQVWRKIYIPLYLKIVNNLILPKKMEI